MDLLGRFHASFLLFLLSLGTPQADGQARPAKDRIIVLSGVVDRSDRVILQPAYVLMGYPDREKEIPPEGNDRRTYTVEVQGESGNVLQERSVSVDFSMFVDPGGKVSTDVSILQLSLPYRPELKRIVIKRGGRDIARVERSPQPPVVRFVSFSLRPDKVAFKLDLADADGDAIHYSIFLIADESTSLLHSGSHTPGKEVEEDTLSSGTVERQGLSFAINRALLGGGKSSFVEVMASDGLNSVTVKSPEFDLGAPPLEVELSWVDPMTGREIKRVPEISSASLRGSAVRTTGGVGSVVPGVWRFESDRDGPFTDYKNEPHSPPVYMSPGRHTVTATLREGDKVVAHRLIETCVDLEPEEWRLLELPRNLLPDDAAAADIDRWITRLASDDVNTREEAEDRLRGIGVPALARLQRVLGSEDPELRVRAERIFDAVLTGWEGRWDHVPSLEKRADSVIRKLRNLPYVSGQVPEAGIRRMLRLFPDQESFWSKVMGCIDSLLARREMLRQLGPGKYVRIYRCWHQTVAEEVKDGLPPGVRDVEGPRFVRWEGNRGRTVEAGELRASGRYSFGYRIRMDMGALESVWAEGLVDGASQSDPVWLKWTGYRSGDKTDRSTSHNWPLMDAGEHRIELYLYHFAAGGKVKIYRAGSAAVRVGPGTAEGELEKRDR